MIIKTCHKEKQLLSLDNYKSIFLICKCLVIFSKLIRDKILVKY